jgi:hypothetical protein
MDESPYVTCLVTCITKEMFDLLSKSLAENLLVKAVHVSAQRSS